MSGCGHVPRRGLNQFMRRVYPRAAYGVDEFCCWTAFAESCLADWIADHEALRQRITTLERKTRAQQIADAGDRRDWDECDRLEALETSHDQTGAAPEALETT